MTEYKEANKIAEIINSAEKIVIVQADNPDADSLASSLALEQILGDMGKQTTMYSGVDIPSYLQYLPGWDRVEKELPKNFDASIIVDTSADTLLEQLELTGQKMWLKNKPTIILDHHPIELTIQFSDVVLNPDAAATAEVIYELAKQLDWKLNQVARNMIAVAILADTMGLMTDSTSARSIHVIAELVEQGVNLPELDSARRDTFRRDPILVHYKGELLQRVQYHSDNQVATLVIPWDEIEKYSPMYNPSMLAIDDMRLAKNTAIAICFKVYPNGRVTAKIRANYGKGIAGKLAEHFGGGGHPYAAGFKVQDKRTLEEIKSEAIKYATELLNNETDAREAA